MYNHNNVDRLDLLFAVVYNNGVGDIVRCGGFMEPKQKRIWLSLATYKNFWSKRVSAMEELEGKEGHREESNASYWCPYFVD